MKKIWQAIPSYQKFSSPSQILHRSILDIITVSSLCNDCMMMKENNILSPAFNWKYGIALDRVVFSVNRASHVLSYQSQPRDMT